jgi:hypothetical protein
MLSATAPRCTRTRAYGALWRRIRRSLRAPPTRPPTLRASTVCQSACHHDTSDESSAAVSLSRRALRAGVVRGAVSAILAHQAYSSLARGRLPTAGRSRIGPQATAETGKASPARQQPTACPYTSPELVTTEIMLPSDTTNRSCGLAAIRCRVFARVGGRTMLRPKS